MSGKERWPRWVYSQGEDPDYRFSFANERTFLAWIRTSLAMLAAAVAVDVVALDLPESVRPVLTGLLVTLGVVSACVAWTRWAFAERAIRGGRQLPSFGFGALMSLGLVAVGVVIGVVVL